MKAEKRPKNDKNHVIKNVCCTLEIRKNSTNKWLRATQTEKRSQQQKKHNVE